MKTIRTIMVAVMFVLVLSIPLYQKDTKVSVSEDFYSNNYDYCIRAISRDAPEEVLRDNWCIN